jgi:hypothetical protein
MPTFSSSSVLCIPALKTGNLTLQINAMVREVLTDPKTGLATGVSYVDTIRMQEVEVRQNRNSRRQYLRIGTASAEFQIIPFPQRTSQQQWRRR